MTHAELLAHAGIALAPQPCNHQLAKLGTCLEPIAVGRVVLLHLFRCRECDLILEVVHSHTPEGQITMKVQRSYRDPTAVWPRRSLL